MLNDGGAHPRRCWSYLANLYSPPLKEVLSLGLTGLMIVPLTAPSESSWMGGDGRCGTYLGRGLGAARSACLDQRAGGGIGVLRSYRSRLHGFFLVVCNGGIVAWWGGGLRPAGSCQKGVFGALAHFQEKTPPGGLPWEGVVEQDGDGDSGIAWFLR